MNKEKSGLIIFSISALYMIGLGWLASWWMTAALRSLTLAQINETIWATDGALFLLWSLSIPLGALFAGVGILLYTGSKGGGVWLFGIGVFLIILVVQLLPIRTHYPPIFGIGGGLILASFLGILWYWAKKRPMIEGDAKAGADFQLVGYVFFLIAMWFLCGEFGGQHWEAFSSEEPASPVSIMIYLVLGWLFHFFGHYKSTQSTLR